MKPKYISVILLITLCFSPLASLAKQPESRVFIHINLWEMQLYVMDETGKKLSSYRVAAGSRDTPSPIGTFHIAHKAKDWGGGFGSRWLGLDVPWGTYGIHGTNRPESIGKFASHGCLRMRNQDIEKLYKQIPKNTLVLIDGPIMGHEKINYRILVPGTRGALVQLVQNKLKAGGYYKGKCHGIFDKQTEQAVKHFQRKEGLSVTGQIQLPDLLYLGIIE